MNVWPGTRLVDHLLVQLADPAAVREMDAEQAAVGDRARVRDRELARPLAGADDVLDAVPDDPRPQLGELLRRVAPVEHVEHVVEQLAVELGERVRAPDQLVQLGHLPLVAGRDAGDDLLRQHVERVARHDRLLDQRLAHPLRDDGRLEQVGAELREDPALRGLADAVPGAADPLKAACDRLRRLDLKHEVDGAHVDAELERRRGHEARQLARLQHLLDDEPLLARERPVVGARDVGRLLRRRLPARSAASPAAPRRGGCSRRRSSTCATGRARAAPGRSPARSSAASRLRRRAGRGRRCPGRARACPRPAPGSPGRAACAGRCRRPCTRASAPRGSGRPPRAAAAWPTGRSAARAVPTSCSSRSSVSARCAPRFDCATAWISSTITHSASRRNSRAREVSMR